MIFNILYFPIAYLLGSFPSALVFGKLFKGIDIREHGSKNLGGTNAIRVLGWKVGGVAALLDFLKGSLAFSLAHFGVIGYQDLALVYGMFAVLGHVYPIFAGFRGGKAVATSAGVITFFNPLIAVVAIVLFTIVVLTTRYVSLGSTTAAIVAFVSMFIIKDLYYYIIASFVLFIVVYRHIPNYKRIINKTEAKIGKKKQSI